MTMSMLRHQYILQPRIFPLAMATRFYQAQRQFSPLLSRQMHTPKCTSSLWAGSMRSRNKLSIPICGLKGPILFPSVLARTVGNVKRGLSSEDFKKQGVNPPKHFMSKDALSHKPLPTDIAKHEDDW
eukprot:Protomagalhaensia_sp_Gyna_25__3692@NODE_3315_length_627_cov_203_722789_g1549_i1_p1_GENE_NODE_3315_length_627_cov_203_722789_g1549_i1NODE_3315_length_627_cov_203_722789_g1549_i1_p1_ORF_typecomplete_len127_score12_49_NODE_3315_length_627_cov_203_722789_g1549_i190470